MRGENRTQNAAEKRAEELRQTRVPVSGARDILKVYGTDPNFVYRFVNDINNRIARFKLGGWEIVTEDLEVGAPRVGVPSQEGTAVKVSVGSGAQAYLMKIKRELYEEDKAAKLRLIDEQEEALLSEHKQEGMYGSHIRTVEVV